jgi:phosphatidate cytidylyltransferase
MKSELFKRTLISIFGIPIIVILSLIGKIPYLILINLILFLSLFEFYSLSQQKGMKPFKLPGILFVLLISFTIYFFKGQGLILLFFFIIFSILILGLFYRTENILKNSSITLFGIFYISLFTSFIMIRELPFQTSHSYQSGGWMIVYLFSIIWTCDSSAYLIGSVIGRHTLFKKISPKKTWEGALGGFLFGLIIAVLFKEFMVPFLTLFDSVVIGSVVGILGQISDLIESMYKRDAHVKDTSNILPGHGGILDRFDSPLLIGPIIYIYLLLRFF